MYMSRTDEDRMEYLAHWQDSCHHKDRLIGSICLVDGDLLVWTQPGRRGDWLTTDGVSYLPAENATDAERLAHRWIEQGRMPVRRFIERERSA